MAAVRQRECHVIRDIVQSPAMRKVGQYSRHGRPEGCSTRRVNLVLHRHSDSGLFTFMWPRVRVHVNEPVTKSGDYDWNQMVVLCSNWFSMAAKAAVS